MKKLILTSNGFENPKIIPEFLKIVGKPASKIKILFIPVASRTKEELHYVDESKEELLKLGIKNENIIYYNLKGVIGNNNLNNFDVVYVCGGNTFYLSYKLKESGFDEKLKKLIQKGVVYVGVSAGTVLAGPNIEIAGADKSWDENDVNLKNFEGLNLTSKIISPHYTSKEEKIILKFEKEKNVRVLRLKDNQALIIFGDKEKLVG